GGGLRLVELPEGRVIAQGAEELDRGLAQLRVLLPLRGREETVVIARRHVRVQDRLLRLGIAARVDLRQEIVALASADRSEITDRFLLEVGVAAAACDVGDDGPRLRRAALRQ